MKIFARASLLLLVITLGAGAYLFSYTAVPVDPNWQLNPADTIPEGAITVRYSGTATLLFSDGETQWMTDGWFTRPGPLQTLFGKIEPDMDAISFGLRQNQADQLAAVFPMHSHYDHAMDAPEVAKRTGAQLLGSEATANIARGWGLPEEQIRVVNNGEAIQLGRFTLTPIESKHFQFPNSDLAEQVLIDSAIPKPLYPPVSAFDYKLGKAYMLHVAHPMGDFLIVGSAGFIPGQLSDMDVDLVFLGVGGLGSQSNAYIEQFWSETVDQISPERIVPIHWDSLVSPLDGPFKGEIRIVDMLAGGSATTRAILQAKATDNPQISFQTLPRFEEVVLFQQ